MLRITSRQNERIKLAVKLRDRSGRDETGWFLIEGYREILRALDNDLRPLSLYICPELFQGSNEPALIARCAERGAEILECSEPVFRKLSYRDRPDGLVLIAPKLERDLSSWVLPANPLILVTEHLEKPGNLGTLLRSADAAGAHGVIVCDRCTDIHNPNVVRSSIGTLFSLPVVEAESGAAIEWLKRQGIRLAAATPHAELDYTEADLSGPLAIAVGSEQLGLSGTWMSQADLRLRIPMRGQCDSLNVSAAATLLLFEAVRQRAVRARAGAGG